MGVNMVGFCISDDEVCREASKQEVIRRYYKAACDYKNGLCDQSVVFRCEALMEELNAQKTDRDVVHYALEKAEKTGGLHCVAIKLNDGHVVRGNDKRDKIPVRHSGRYTSYLAGRFRAYNGYETLDRFKGEQAQSARGADSAEYMRGYEPVRRLRSAEAPRAQSLRGALNKNAHPERGGLHKEAAHKPHVRA